MDLPVKLDDRLAYRPNTDGGNDDTQDYLLFMIGGNPGLISYYEPFLSQLHESLSASSGNQSSQFYVYGFSLAGFENGHLAGGEKASEPIGLQKQIQNTEDLIYSQIYLHSKANPSKETLPKVVLMGHSVGGYILLEMIRRHKERVERDGEGDFDLIGGILLFPTIVNIAKSPMGIVASVSLQSLEED